MYHETLTAEPITANSVARLMAWTWEGGRRYGVQQAMAILDSTTTEFKSGVDAVLNAALNGTLDLPSPEPEHRPGEVVPIDGGPGDLDESGDARSTHSPIDTDSSMSGGGEEE